MRHFHYLVADEIVRVTASRQPSAKTRTRSGTWVVQDRKGMDWVTPSFPEITWGTLKTLEYLGSVPAESHQEGEAK